MAKTKITIDNKGLQELMKSKEMNGVLMECASKSLQKLGAGYEASEYTGKSRSNVSVYAVTKDAQKENLENNSILKAVFS